MVGLRHDPSDVVAACDLHMLIYMLPTRDGAVLGRQRRLEGGVYVQVRDDHVHGFDVDRYVKAHLQLGCGCQVLTDHGMARAGGHTGTALIIKLVRRGGDTNAQAVPPRRTRPHIYSPVCVTLKNSRRREPHSGANVTAARS